ncbi:hypothetical protein [Streptosporangium sp. NPDC004631]
MLEVDADAAADHDYVQPSGKLMNARLEARRRGGPARLPTVTPPADVPSSEVTPLVPHGPWSATIAREGTEREIMTRCSPRLPPASEAMLRRATIGTLSRITDVIPLSGQDSVRWNGSPNPAITSQTPAQAICERKLVGHPHTLTFLTG